MALLDTVGQIERGEVSRRRRSMGQRVRRFRGQATTGLPPVNPPNMPESEVASYHRSRYAGNADDQNMPYYLPPPVSVGYDMQEVLARMHENFLKNRERFAKMREQQQRMFAAINPNNGQGQNPIGQVDPNQMVPPLQTSAPQPSPPPGPHVGPNGGGASGGGGSFGSPFTGVSGWQGNNMLSDNTNSIWRGLLRPTTGGY